MRDCQVKQLRLRAGSVATAHHAAQLVEDALHTASLPGMGSRLVIIRALALGRIGHNASPLAVSLQVEQALQRLPWQLIHATQPGAEHAPAVYFRDEAEALALLGVQIAKGAPPSAWFWSRVAAGYRPTLAAADLLRIVLRAAVNHKNSAIVLVRLVQALVEAEVVAVLLQALQPADGPLLLAHCGWSAVPSGATHMQSPLRHRPLFTAVIGEWLGRWSEGDLRLLWLANVLTVMAQPHSLTDPSVSQQSRHWIEQIAMAASRAVQPAAQRSSQPSRQVEEQTVLCTDAAHAASYAVPAQASRTTQHAALTPLPITPPGEDSVARVEGMTQAQPGAVTAEDHALLHNSASHSLPPQETSAGHTQPPAAPSPVAPAAARTDGTSGTDDLVADRWHGDLQTTAAGGLFFLLAALRRLGLGDWIEAHPHWRAVELPQRVLAAISHQLAVPPTDPIWQTVALSAPEVDVDRLDWFEAPLQWAAWGIPLADATPARLTIDEAVNRWLAAVIHWCTTVAQLDLATIVHRQGRLHVTPTHIDLTFALAQVDLRIRTAGLDIDPGWVAWFGRVILFHYE